MNDIFQYPFAFSFRQEATFGTYIDGTENALSSQYLQSFAASRDHFCLLWGGPATGKTHLLQALCQQQTSAVYLPMRELAAYDPGVLKGLESSALLVLDDVDAVLGQREWEEQIFWLFNTLQQQGGKLCMSSSKALSQLPFSLADLHSRLQLATAFELHACDDETRPQLLQALATQRGIELKPEVSDYLLIRSQRDNAGLLSILNQLDTLSLAEKRRITIPFVREKLGW